jgi:hypothetical protein
MLKASFLILTVLILAACDQDQTYSTHDGDVTIDLWVDMNDTSPDPASDPVVDTAIDDGGSLVEQICNRWNADRADLSEGSWSGSVSGCNPGDVAANGRDNTLKLVNLYRWMCGLNDDVSLDSTKNSEAQACALMMHANGDLDHSPPTSWTCYSADGANGAGNSNIATTPAVQAMDMYMQDWGNDTTMGHRRWILSNALSSVGVGSTSEYSCLWVLHYPFSGGNAWTAWPPPGPFPYEGVTMSWVGLDETGWTIQSDTINLSGATVTVTDGGTNRPVTVTHLLASYGSDFAISFLPSGWSSQVGHTYHVEVTGISPTISYDVEIVDCG